MPDEFDSILDDVSEAEMAGAVRTLRSLGYTYHGGEQWKPPIGEKPDFDQMDAAVAKERARCHEICQWVSMEEKERRQNYAAMVAMICADRIRGGESV